MVERIITSIWTTGLGGLALKTIPDITPKAGPGSKAIQDLAGNMLFVVLILCGIGVLLAAACIALGWLIKNGTLKSAGIAGVLCSVAAPRSRPAPPRSSTSALGCRSYERLPH